MLSSSEDKKKPDGIVCRDITRTHALFSELFESAKFKAQEFTNPWIMAMQWHDLLFMHWPIPEAMLRPWIPPALTIDSYGGSAWLGIVPFVMRGVRARGMPTIPGLSAFPELNVRSYVSYAGKPGVWFFSLDAANWAAVRAARLGFHLPYFDANMQTARAGETVHYTSIRSHARAAAARFEASYAPLGPTYLATSGSLEDWLTSRYSLYAADQHGRLWRGMIAHAPWPLQAASCDLRVQHMTEQIGLHLPGKPSLLHFVRRLDVVAWLPERIL